MKPKRVFEFAEDEPFVVIQDKNKLIFSQGRTFELRAMLAAYAYSLIKREIVDPADIFKDLMTAVKFADAEKSGRLEELIAEDEETLPQGIKEMIDGIWDDLSELSGGSDDHCS